MEKSREGLPRGRTVSGFLILAVAAALAYLLCTPFIAHACNTGTSSGNESTPCSVDWRAKSILSATLTNDDPEYPGLMTDYVTGQPEDSYTNGGYITAVKKELGDPGIFEVMHFYYGAGENLTQAWRVAIATDNTMLDGKITFSLPTSVVEAGCPVSFDAASMNAHMTSWGGEYAAYEWLSGKAGAIDNGDGTWTIDIGDLPRGKATVFQFDVKIGQTAYTPADRFIAEANLKARYAPGTDEGNCPEIPDAPPRPELDGVDACRAEFGGQTLWTVYDRDITDRYKVYGSTTSPSDLMGEVNTDGWNIGADGWEEGNKRIFRLYAATKKELLDATWVIDVVQGFAFEVGAGDVDHASPADGMLQANGYTASVEGVTITPAPDGKRIVVTIERMPAQSSLSFIMIGALDGSRATMAINHNLKADLAFCVLNPDPKVEYGEWVDNKKDCKTLTVEQSRSVTTTPFVWDAGVLEYVPGTPFTTGETRLRPMTDAEAALCPPSPPAPTSPKPEPPKPDLTKPEPPKLQAPKPLPQTEKKELTETGDSRALLVVILGTSATIGAALALGARKRVRRNDR